MSLVGKKFPNITVDAISFMGENLRMNVLEEATKNNKLNAKAISAAVFASS